MMPARRHAKALLPASIETSRPAVPLPASVETRRSAWSSLCDSSEMSKPIASGSPGRAVRVEGREAGALRPAVAERLDGPRHRRPAAVLVADHVDDVGDLLPADRDRPAGKRDGVDQRHVLVEDGEAALHRPVLLVRGQRAERDPDLEVLAAPLHHDRPDRGRGERDLAVAADQLGGGEERGAVEHDQAAAHRVDRPPRTGRRPCRRCRSRGRSRSRSPPAWRSPAARRSGAPPRRCRRGRGRGSPRRRARGSGPRPPGRSRSGARPVAARARRAARGRR